MSIYFKDSEIEGLQQALVDKLDAARRIAAVPFVITSGKRTANENAAAGGVSDSSHTRGLAVDLSCSDGRARYRILKGLLSVGFNRIGVYDRHIHADIDSSLPQEVIWVGISH